LLINLKEANVKKEFNWRKNWNQIPWKCCNL